MSPKFWPVRVTESPGAGLGGAVEVITGGGGGAGAGGPCSLAVTLSLRPALRYLTCDTSVPVTGELAPDGAVTVQDWLPEAPSARSPAATGDAGVTVQPAGAPRLTDRPRAEPGPALCSVVVTVVDAPAARLSGVEGSMLRSTAAGSGELTAVPPISLTTAPARSGRPSTCTTTVSVAAS